MTGICGVVGSQEESVASAVETMLGSMKKRGTIAQSIIVGAEEKLHLGLGTCDSSLRPTSPDLDFWGELTVAVDGFFAEAVGRKTGRELDASNPLSRVLRVPGAFSFLGVDDGRLYAGRDAVGQKPLYYGTRNDGSIGFASLLSALQEVGIPNAQPIPPGQIIAASEKGCEALEGGYRLDQFEELEVSEAEAVTKLSDLFVEAVASTLPNGCGIAFSGGLDSTLVAAAAKRTGLSVRLVTVGMEDQAELEHARNVAEQMELPVTIGRLSSSQIIDSIPTVVETVESTDPMVVGVSIPLYLACLQAKEAGVRIIAAGQLSDELFAGYARFEELALKEGAEGVRSEVWNSVQAASVNDFEPGDKVAVSLGLELRCPFAYLPLVEYALRLPTSLKLKVSQGTVVRKYVLRRLAAEWGIPDTVVNRPKKAVQYSSGVQRVLAKEARRRNKSVKGFLESIAA